ncbi:hypothetical protein Q1L76_03860 [Staphylococcus hominis]|uniref:hypothetical protein n=1 Tax=Staphylococcus hominis TaxID=1290 RepID=UPI0011A5EE0A|nr:hypothetical protein [Staphylococcus hominis]MDO0996634.1 hypothetical protein [Staphylococcus hominis]
MLKKLKIALLIVILAEEIRSAKRNKYKVRMEISNLNELESILNETKEKLKDFNPSLNQV